MANATHSESAGQFEASNIINTASVLLVSLISLSLEENKQPVYTTSLTCAHLTFSHCSSSVDFSATKTSIEDDQY